MPPPPPKSPLHWRLFFERFGPLIALLLLIIGTTIVEYARLGPDQQAVFLTPRNFANILGQSSYVGILAVGMTFVIILGGIDLSVGSLVALAAGASVYTLNAAAASWSPSASIAVAAAVCLVIGLLGGLSNGLIIAKGRIAPFVATLGTFAAFRSIIMAKAEGSEIRSTVSALGDIGGITVPIPYLGPDGAALNLRFPVLVFLAAAILAHLVLTRTAFGRQVFAIGDNPRAARYAGIHTSRITIAVYTIAGLTCGLTAFLRAAQMNSVSSASLGLYNELDAIAAVVIGGTRLQGGAGRVWGTVVGVLILGIVTNMLTMLEVSTHYQGLVKGLIIIAAVLIQPRKSTD